MTEEGGTHGAKEPHLNLSIGNGMERFGGRGQMAWRPGEWGKVDLLCSRHGQGVSLEAGSVPRRPLSVRRDGGFTGLLRDDKGGG